LDESIPNADEPRALHGPDATPTFVDYPGYSDDNVTEALDFDSIREDGREDGRELLVVESVVVGFQIAAVAAPIIADIINGQRKKCQQLACWIGTQSRTCAYSVAERVQSEITMGRDRFSYESLDKDGIWVRYWRTKFEPVDRGDIVTGTCTNGVPYHVTNCMTTGRVKC
jgi:hypothetical protein